MYQQGLDKYWLNFTEGKNENQYLTNLSNNATF